MGQVAEGRQGGGEGGEGGGVFEREVSTLVACDL